MAELILNAEVRTKTGKGHAKKLRFANRVPAVIYGKDIATVHCSLDKSQVDMVIRRANRNALYNIKLDNGEGRSVIIRDFQKHPLSHDFDHIDFQAIQMDKPLLFDVDINFVGTPAGKKTGGIFTALCKQVKVECLPGKIPEKIDLNIEDLEIGDSLHVYDIKADDLTIVTDLQIALCQVSKAREEEAEEIVETDEVEAGEVEAGETESGEEEVPTTEGK